jgi:CubicO group peptidase (beta-lactamase class C family)
MNRLILYTALAIICISSNFCSKKDANTLIEGLWITTEESSQLFAPGAHEAAIMISRDSSGAHSARGFFLYNNEFKFEWEFAHTKYDGKAKQISILDADSDTLIFTLDTENEMLKGAIHLQDNTQESLELIRADKDLETRLFHPRMPDENGQISYCYSQPEQDDDGLKTESIFRYTSDSSSISKLVKEVIDQKYGRMKSLLILKNNKLVLEEYFYGYKRNELQQNRSCSKSVTSILLGIALDRQNVVDTGKSIFDFFPAYASLKNDGRENITLEHVLTMMAGFEWNDIPPEMFHADDCFQYILSRPLEAEPGEKFIYNSGCTILLGGVVNFLEAMKTEVFAEDFLFTPLAITDYIWETHIDGTLLCGSGLSLRPRDMAKIGLLVLNEGKWQNKQIAPQEWIRMSTEPHVRESPFFNYGYQWWHHSRNTLQWWKEPHTTSPEEHDLVTAMGHGGQYIMVIRDLNLVIVTTASDFEDGRLARSKIPMVIEEIIPIFEDI